MLPFAYMFAFFGMIAGLPAVQASEIVRITESLFFSDAGPSRHRRSSSILPASFCAANRRIESLRVTSPRLHLL